MWKQYEEEKKKLENLTPEEYEEEIKKILERIEK